MVLLISFCYVVSDYSPKKADVVSADAIILPALVASGLLAIMGAMGITNSLDSNVSGSSIIDSLFDNMGLLSFTDSKGRTIGSFGVDAVALESGRLLISNAFANFGKEFTESYIADNNITVSNPVSLNIDNLFSSGISIVEAPLISSVDYEVPISGATFIPISSIPFNSTSSTNMTFNYSDFLILLIDSDGNQYGCSWNNNFTWTAKFDSNNSYSGSYWSGSGSLGVYYYHTFSNNNYYLGIGWSRASGTVNTRSGTVKILSSYYPSGLTSALEPTYEDYEQAFEDAVKPDTEENEDEKTVGIPLTGEGLLTGDDIIDGVLDGTVTVEQAVAIEEEETSFSEETQTTTRINDVDSIQSYQPSDSFFNQLKSVFPFCLPFDFRNAIALLNASPQAPEFDWIIPGAGYFEDQEIHISLEQFNSVASVFRTLMLILFIIGLIFITRKLIMWWQSG